MSKIILLIILSPLAMLCGILSRAIIYIIIKKFIEIKFECVQTINDLINNRKDSQC